jgi:hypothetical protein
MTDWHRRRTRFALALTVAWFAPALAMGQIKPAPRSEGTPSPIAGPTDKLASEEQRIAEKYKHLEDVLLRMAELNAASDPRRAALLKKVVGQSKEQLIAVRLDRLVELLGKDQLARALENENDVDQDMRAILELLMSENRVKHIESEKARTREQLKQLNGIIKQQKDIQGRTAGGDDPQRLAGEQGKVADKTGELAQDVQKAAQNAEGAGKKKDGKDGEKGKGKEDENKPDRSGSQASSVKQPAHERLDAARQRMQEAQTKLKQAERQGAADKQEEALRQLQQAKAQLEEILRQLREEEIERALTMLEGRFRAMLQMQEEVYEGTVRLDKTPSVERTHSHEIEASRLSGKQSQIVVEMDKALLLLREDGTAAAMLEAADQLRDDMQQVVVRLARAQVGKTTKGIETDIIAALKETIEALKKAQKDREAKKRRAGQTPAGQPQDPPLVDLLAELKMIRALQMRVNTRTARYAKLIDGEQADNAELIDALKRLGERQQRIHRVTRDLQMGKNQ